MIDRDWIAAMRAKVEAENMAWGDVAELQSAFEEIDPDTLPEPAENAGWSDMLDELEARLPGTHEFTVVVSECTSAEARRVMAERIDVDEDYGFHYRIGWGASR